MRLGHKQMCCNGLVLKSCVKKKRVGRGVVQARHREGYYLAETNTYHENIPNSKTACVRTERQQVGTK